jgi:hypothetical protein
MRVLEGRTEGLAGSFTVQDLANTLWLYATMGRKPGSEVMRELEGLADSLAHVQLADRGKHAGRM